jgi:putative Ca2+/H+ antiporter (TMEM165/GDT1 family)
MDWGVFFSVFGLVFVAELGDKTQLAVVTQTCKYRRPWGVFVGASAALAVVTALGALGGRALGSLLPETVVRVGAALVFLAMGGAVAREAARAERDPWCEMTCDQPRDEQTAGPMASLWWSWEAFTSTFGLLLLAELGDKTQLTVLGFASEHRNVWAVLGGGALALTAVTALGIIGGRVLCELVSRRVLLWVSAVAFIAIGAFMALGGL